MKNTTLKATILALALSVGVTGCATNTQNQNTVLGAGTGAVIGGAAAAIAGGTGWAIAGTAIAGALIGGYVGHEMESTDKQQMNVVMTTAPKHHGKTWKNKHTNMTYRIVPTSKMMTINGNHNCRTYNAYATDGQGKTTMNQGVACLQRDGSWIQMSRY